MHASSDAGTRVTTEAASPLLRTPVELRLAIYELALSDSPRVTVGHAEAVGEHHDVIHHLYAGDRAPYPGLPQNHVPIIAPTYDGNLLSITHPAILSAGRPLQEFLKDYSTHESLLLVNRQINEELTSHFQSATNRRTSIFASFPYGLHILKTSASKLLNQARSIHLAGEYRPDSFNSARAAREAAREPPARAARKHHGGTKPDPAALLGRLIASTFGPHPTHHVRKLEMRIYYPGDDSYSTVWGDDNSPIVVALRNTSLAEVEIEVWRGPRGTGIYLTARPSKEGKRVVSTIWRKLEEGRRGEPEAGSWVVDPKWPDWVEEYDLGGGAEGNVFTSVPGESATAGAFAS